MRIGGCHTRGNAGLALFSPLLSPLCLYVSLLSRIYLPSCPPLPLPLPRSHARLPHPLTRHRPPPRAPGSQASQSPPPPPPQIHAMLLAADHEKNHSRWRGTLPPCTPSPSPPTPSPGRPPSQTVSVSPQRPSPERPPLPSASGSTPVPGQTLPTPAGLPTSSR